MGYIATSQPVSKLSAVTALSAGDYVMVSKLSDDSLYYSNKIDFGDVVSCFIGKATTDLSGYFRSRTSALINTGTVDGRKWEGAGSYAAVALRPNDGGAGNQTAAMGAEIGGLTDIPDPRWSRSGFRMEGWSTEPDGTGKEYAIAGPAECFGDYDLYARWQKTRLSVHFVDGFDGSEIGAAYVEAGYPAPAPAFPAHAGFQPGAWSCQLSSVVSDMSAEVDFGADAPAYGIVVRTQDGEEDVQVSSGSVRVCDGSGVGGFASARLSAAVDVADPMLSATRLGNGAFRNSAAAMPSLRSVDFRNARELGDECFMNAPSGLVRASFPLLSSAGQRAFRGSFLQDVSCDGVLLLGDGAFERSRLSGIALPMLRRVPERAFYGADGLVSAYLPEALSVMGSAFAPDGDSWNSFASVHIPKAEYVGPRAFRDCPISAFDGGRVFVADDGAFKQTFSRAALRSAAMPHLQYVGSECFMNQVGLLAADFPAVYVGDRAFFGCSGLRSVSMDGVLSVGDGAFACRRSDPGRVSSFSFASLGWIGDGAFERQVELVSVDLPSVTYVGDRAFAECARLKRIGFSAEHEQEIRSLASWGQISAVSVFDLG